MTRNALQSTMRELQRAGRTPLLWLGLIGAAFVLGLVGPFGTYATMQLPARLAYWGAVAVGSYFIAFGSIVCLERTLFEERPKTAIFGLMGAAAGIPVSIFVFSLNLSVFDSTPIGFWPLLAYVMAISAAVSATVAAFSRGLQPRIEPSRSLPVPVKARLLQRLAPASRGRLLYLSMQDHYVEVHTQRGRELVLMRLADAIAEADGVDGVQIHRSHWVAIDAVRGSKRRNGRLYVEMENGAELPVSRGYADRAKAAGLG